MASSSGAPKVCFNSTCNQALEVARRGWLCRTGDFADLCDRCGSAFDDGKFCDTYHLNASGWRCCESCGKQIHCGCIVSFHMFILLDAGGIECLKCAKTEYILTPNPTWPSASHFLKGPAERINNVSSKSWRSITGSGPVPWRQAPTLFNAFKGHVTRVDPPERFVNDSWRVRPQEMIDENALASGMQYNAQHNLLKDVSYKSFFHTNAIPLSSLPATSVPRCQKTETGNVSGIHVKRLGKQCFNSNGSGPSYENQAHNTTTRCETRAYRKLPACYWPRSMDQEHQQLQTGLNTKITPLFEKVLTASDVGKIGRLILPKKYAETYFPLISEPEGYPLVIQDLKGKNWVLQYRYWPNNNSRMYVLEGITPYIQSMQLQAGDTVTFGRLEPEGKLVMGFRRSSSTYPSDKGNETRNTRISCDEESLKDDVDFKSRNPDGTVSKVDKLSIRAKRKKGVNMCSISKNLKHKEEEMSLLSVTLEQVQGLLQPPRTNARTIVLIDCAEFEVFQEAPIIGIPKSFSTDNVGSLCSTEVEPSPEHQEHMFPMINHENSEPPNPTNHNSTCTCNVCISVNRPPPPMTHRVPTHPEQQTGNLIQNPTRSMYADIICYTQMGNGYKNHKPSPAQCSENVPESTFKSQNIDLNMQPDREEESYPVSDSMGIMSLVQESTQRYIKQQRLSIDRDHKNHDL